jgi:hypothetical protein
MKLENLPVGIINWPQVPASVHPGTSGTARARTRQIGDVQLRLVDYSAGYVAEHWCPKGHIVFVVAGDITIEHQDGRKYALTVGTSYHVADDDGAPHRALSKDGATIFIVD